MSGLSDTAMLDHSFYLEDCRKVGVLPGPDPGDLQEKQRNTVLFVFIISIFSILLSAFNIYLTLLIGISVLAFKGLQLGSARRYFYISKNMNYSLLTASCWDIRNPANRLDPPPPGSLYSETELNKMDIRLANIAYYHANSQKLIKDIVDVSKGVLLD